MGKKKKIPANYMDIIFQPAQGLSWREKKDGSIELDMVHKGFYHKIAQKFFHRPRVSHISLDSYGSALWKALDGKQSVHDVVQSMVESFPDEEDRMLDRVVTFLGTLEMNHFVERKGL